VTAHEDYRGLLCKLGLKILHVREDMKAVDTAVGPEVNKDQFVLQLILEGEGLRIQPSMPHREILSF
jgi:hypothetical protein